EHRRIGALAHALGIELITVGAPTYGGQEVADARSAVVQVGDVAAGVAVLVKASRAAGMERLAAALVAGPAGPGGGAATEAVAGPAPADGTAPW
ncbi:MAG: UDP-N-acetylmuramoyl-tripeptide--D-alanyl-D-alanine ligase, partial [Acidimicrobiales bacterium]